MKLGENGEAFFVEETENDEVSSLNNKCCSVVLSAKDHCEKCNMRR